MLPNPTYPSQDFVLPDTRVSQQPSWRRLALSAAPACRRSPAPSRRTAHSRSRAGWPTVSGRGIQWGQGWGAWSGPACEALWEDGCKWTKVGVLVSFFACAKNLGWLLNLPLLGLIFFLALSFSQLWGVNIPGKDFWITLKSREWHIQWLIPGALCLMVSQ